MMKTSGIYHLCLALWPDPMLFVGEQQAAGNELVHFIIKVWHKIQEFASAVGLPVEFVGPEREKKDDFIAACVADLGAHLSASSAIIHVARTRFQTSSQATVQAMQDGELLPKPRGRKKGKPMHIFDTESYFDSVALAIPALSVLVTILRKGTNATEAAVERMFSSEAIIHDKLRNSTRVGKTENVMRVRWNFEPLKEIFVALGLPTDLPDVEEDEDENEQDDQEVLG
jgi:hypothetical protein